MRLENCSPSYKDMMPTSLGTDWRPNAKTSGFTFTGSGKAALSVVLQYLKVKGVLTNKMSQVLVPEWIGIAVYQTLFAHCFPTKTYSDAVKVIIAYHQYGFPQNMEKLIDFCQDKKIILIEDCAHTIDSKYKSIPLGSFGDFSIYSFSKFIFCFALGGISFKDPEFTDYFFKMEKEASFFLMSAINAFKLFDETLIAHSVNLEKLRMMFYSLYHRSYKSSSWAKGLLVRKIDNEIQARKKNYHYLINELKDYTFVEDLDLDVVPFAVPLLIKKRRDKIVEKIREANIECGEYFFDVNRLVINPKFEKCVLVPLNSNMSLDNMDVIVSSVKKYCKE